MPPFIESSTKEERLAYILKIFKCKHHCESCGLCQVYKGKELTKIYKNYIDGIESFQDIAGRYK